MHPADARLLLDREPRLQASALPRERALAKLRAGTPLLHGEPVSLDLEFATELFLRLVRERGQRGRAIVQAVRRDQLDLDRLLTEAFVQHADHVRQIAALPRLDQELVSRLATRAVRPLLRGYAQRLASLVENLGVWERGYCPICGGASLPGEDGSVRCGACGYSWHGLSGGAAFRIELALPEEDSW